MKREIIVALVVFAYCFFLYWLGGGVIERSEDFQRFMIQAPLFSLFMAALFSAISSLSRQNKKAEDAED